MQDHVIASKPKSQWIFSLPANLAADAPREVHGHSRSNVRLMIINRRSGSVLHSGFENLHNFLRSGDLLVFNSSRTLPALLVGYDIRTGMRVEVRLAEHLPDDSWLGLILFQEGEPIQPDPLQSVRIEFGHGLSCFVNERDERVPRLWRVRFSASGPQLISLIYELGHPIRYEHVSSPWNLDYYQNVYANQPGSSEMPSAGRAFTWKMLFDLKKAGIDATNIVLHAGLSSYMDDELDAKKPTSEEEYIVSPMGAAKINLAHFKGNRVIAVGTTVVRALETAADQYGFVSPSHGYTRLHIDSNYKLRSVDGLLTGFHEPQASHLDLLKAFVPQEVLRHAYDKAIKLGYLWHEFGDLNLIL